LASYFFIIFYWATIKSISSLFISD